MKTNKLLEKVNGSIHKASFTLKKHSPEILVVAGVTGAVVSAVMACKATTKISDILEDTKEQIDTVHAALENEELSEKYSTDDAKKDTAIIYAQCGLKLAKLYAPSVILGTLSITSILASNNIIRKRNLALAAAYASVDKSFKEYRGRVAKRFGDDVEYEIRHDIQKTKIEEEIVDENGKTKKVKATVDAVANPVEDEYVKYFTRSNPYWDNNQDYVEMFLRSQQNYANDRLRIEKVLTLNDVYESLGFQKTKAGMVVGWTYDENNPNGDNFVEFEVHKVYIPDDNGNMDTAYAIDFNVDGNIYNKI